MSSCTVTHQSLVLYFQQWDTAFIAWFNPNIHLVLPLFPRRTKSAGLTQAWTHLWVTDKMVPNESWTSLLSASPNLTAAKLSMHPHTETGQIQINHKRGCGSWVFLSRLHFDTWRVYFYSGVLMCCECRGWWFPTVLAYDPSTWGDVHLWPLVTGRDPSVNIRVMFSHAGGIRSIGPPLWSRLKYLTNNQMDCRESLHIHSGSPEDEPYWLWSDPLTFPLAPPWGWDLCFLAKCLNSWIDHHEIWFTHSCPPQDEFWMWSHVFFFI